MTAARPVKQSHVIFCACAYYEVIPRTTREQTLAGLRQNGVTPEVVSDLCGLAANRDLRLKDWVDEGPLTIAACFPRAVRWLFHAAGVTLNEQVRFLNMRTQSPEEIIGQIVDCGLRIADSHGDTNPQSEIINPQSGWVPWFPVIDYSRCKSCKQCLNFCLFGVYALSDEGRVEVRKPSGCKTNCPACARMCPTKAIIFPKYGEAHINGDEVPAGAADSNPQSSDILERIREHSAGRKRFAKQADTSSRSCPTLESLRRELGIPEDVLTSLSPAELLRIQAEQTSSRSTNADRKDGGHDG